MTKKKTTILGVVSVAAIAVLVGLACVLFRKDVPSEATATEVTPGGSQEPSELFDFAASDVFLKVGEDDILTWGQVTAAVDASVARLKRAQGLMMKPTTSAERDEAEYLNRLVWQRAISRELRGYLKSAVFAHEARQAGLMYTPEALEEKRAEMIKQYKGRKDYGAQMVRLLQDPESLNSKKLKNMLLADLYVEKILKPSLTVSPEDIAYAIKLRHDYNLSCEPTNDLYRAQMQQVYTDLSTNGIDFAEAVFQYSEDGGDQGYFGKYRLDELMSQMRPVIPTLKPGQISPVIETPVSFHILKLLSVDRGDEEETAPEDFEYELSHIMIEKLRPEPEFTEETARAFALNKMVRGELRIREAQLLATPGLIECKIPIFEEKKKRKARKRK